MSLAVLVVEVMEDGEGGCLDPSTCAWLNGE
jgi:hypothetical protein